MKKTCFAAASLLLMMLHSSAARGEEALPQPIAVVKNVLQLSESQVGALITMIQTRNAALQPIAARIHENQEVLGKLVDSPDADPATAGRLLLAIHADEKQLAGIAQNAASSFEEVLSPEQRERLHLFRQAAQIEPVLPAFKAIGLM